MERNMRLTIILGSLTLLLISCSKEGDNPAVPSNQPVVVFTSSFESNGNSSLVGWQIIDTSRSNLISFSRDIPQDGGSWSLMLRGTSFNGAGVRTFIVAPPLSSQKKYFLTYSAKGTPGSDFCISFVIWQSPIISVVLSSAQYSTWTNCVDTLLSGRSTSDTLETVSYTHLKLPKNTDV